MNEEQRKFLNLEEKPARLMPEQVAWRLNFNAHDIPILVQAKLLRPLGSPRKSAVKYFAMVDIDRLSKDSAWLARATNAIYDYWQKKSHRRGMQRND